ncbi:MAG TPA: PAS domain S-box protein [Methylomirabilota bacterium]|nr:PAS domain S-box protein [Methylomirabilota bacterium]
MAEHSSANAFSLAAPALRASRWLIVVPAAALVLLLGAGTLETWIYWKGVDLQDRVRRAYASLEQQVAFQAGLFEIDALARGYVLTGEPVFLADFHRATALVEQALAQGLAALPSDAGQTNLLAALHQQTREYLRRWEETVELRRRGDTAAAAAAQRQLENRDQRERVLTELNALIHTQRNRVNEYERDHRQMALLVWAIASGAGVLAVGSLIVSWAGLLRENYRRHAAEAGLQKINVELERRVAERTAILEDREQRLQAVLNSAVEGIITMNPRGIVESINPAAEKMFGYRAEEVIGRNVSLLMPEPYRSEHDAYLSRYLATGQAKIIGIGREAFGQRKDGSVFPIHLSVSEIRLGAQRVFTGLVRDLTERKRLEAQAVAAAEQERGRIARDLHDGLGQELGGALFLSSLLQRDLKERNAAEAGRAAEIHQLIEQALADARTISRGLYPVPPEPDGLMTALQNLADRVTRDCGVDCRFDADSAVLMDDPAAASHLYRLAQEAVSNAVKYSGSPRIEIRLTTRSHELELIVRDYGKGLPADAKPAGLGTQTMRHRTQQLGGRLTVENAPDGGVEVRCVAPYYRVKPVAAAVHAVSN